MAKYSFDFKLKVVMDYLDGEGSMRYLSKKHGVTNESQVRKWLDSYNQLGTDGLRKKMSNKKYSGEFKLSVLQYRQINKKSYRETAKYFNISNSSMIANWQRAYSEKGFQGLERSIGRPSIVSDNEKKKKPVKISESEKEELIRLRQENEFLRASLEYEKKLQALVQQRERKTKKRQN